MRINELARELEVKAGIILDLLPKVGLQERKTHSSSIDPFTADKVRELIRGMESAQPEELPELELPPPPRPAATAPVPRPTAQPTGGGGAKPRIPIGGGSPIRPPMHALRPPLTRAKPASVVDRPGVTEPPSEPAPAPPDAKPVPAPPTVEGLPPASPAAKRGAVPRPAAPGPAASRPEAPRRPVPTVPQIPRDRPSAAPAAQVKPIPAQQGGQLAQGPRTPLPAAPGRPQPRIRPALPRRQPARPLVPGRRTTGPAAAPRPRPGKPEKPVLVPGQPIYQRPRPSGPVPGMPVPSAGPRTRVMHPGARPAGRGAPPVGRHERGGPRPGPRTARDREAEREERLLRQQAAARAKAAEMKAVNTEVTVSEGTTVKELAEKLGIKANLVIKALVDKGLFATINQTLDMETLQELCKQFGATTTEVSFEEEALQELELTEAPGDLQDRAPVVTVMGHVDHGKTSLLDAIRNANVADREAGGITQSIGAYQVTHNSRNIVFIDTPGHEAFTRMRARGADVTDVVILVVAADDGVMPQTIEAIDHAKAAGVPLVVAVNKMDVSGADPDRVKQQLSDRGLLPEEWGGDTVTVPVSAKTKENLDSLLEMVLLVADLKELKANPARPAIGTVLEAKLDRGKGPVATVLVQNGTLRTGDHLLVGAVFGRVRSMLNDRGQKVKEAPPSSAVVLLGLDDLPAPGDSLQVVTDKDKARKISEYREEKAREQALAKTARLSLEQFQDRLRAGEAKELRVVLKCDVQGSAEVLSDALEKLSNPKVQVRLMHAGVGAISQSDVTFAATASAIIIGFNVRPERGASALAEEEGIDIRLHTVIYELVDEIKKAMAGLLEPIIKETWLGRAEVLQTFRVTKVGTVAGCLVQEGTVPSGSQARLLRDNVVVHTGKLSSLKRFKEDVSEVRAGQECGIGLERFNDVKVRDVIEVFSTEKVTPELPV